jgi:hypothetical protein
MRCLRKPPAALAVYRIDKGPGPLLISRWQLGIDVSKAIAAGTGGVRTAWDGKGCAGGSWWGGVAHQAVVAKAGARRWNSISSMTPMRWQGAIGPPPV